MRQPSQKSDLEVLLESLAEDVWSEEYTDEDIERDLRESGLDPEEIGREGAALAAKLLEQRREPRRELSDDADASASPGPSSTR